jgi:hypothetical protein
MAFLAERHGVDMTCGHYLSCHTAARAVAGTAARGCAFEPALQVAAGTVSGGMHTVKGKPGRQMIKGRGANA